MRKDRLMFLSFPRMQSLFRKVEMEREPVCFKDPACRERARSLVVSADQVQGFTTGENQV